MTIHYVTSEQQAADHGVSACGITDWTEATSDIDAVDCLACLRGEIRRLEKALDEIAELDAYEYCFQDVSRAIAKQARADCGKTVEKGLDK